MKKIRKIIKQALTTGTTTNNGVKEFIIVPDLNAKYHMSILLYNEAKDIGFFDANTKDFIEDTTLNGQKITITGESKSRLFELKKYKTNGDFFEKYKLSTSSDNDGVNPNLSNINVSPRKVVYYIGGITYTDFTDPENVRTIFSFEGQGYNSPDFINAPIYKDPDKNKIIQKPKIDNDVFIVRQELSAFDKIYKLGEIYNLQQLLNYAGGSYFNIESNT